MQYDSDSPSSCGTNTESDDSSISSNEIPSPVRDGREGAAPVGPKPPTLLEVGQQSSSLAADRGAGDNSRKRRSGGKSPANKKKARAKSTPQGHSSFVNLSETVTKMQHLKSHSPVTSSYLTPGGYSTNYSAAFPGNSSQYAAAAAVNSYSLAATLPANTLNYASAPAPAPPPTTHAQYPSTFAQYFGGNFNAARPGYYQWASGYSTMQYPSSYQFYSQNSVNSNGSNNGNVYR